MNSSPNTDFFPHIFRVLDIGAIRTQRLFFRLLILDVLLLILIPASILLTSFLNSDTIFRSVPIILIFVVFSLNLAWPTTELVKNWQTLRSAAESVKKECIIYSVGCPPYHKENEQEAKEKLIGKIDKILESVNKKFEYLPSNESSNLYFTESERKIRSSNFEERVDYYLKNRLEEQIDWYREKSNRNNSSDSTYKKLMILFLIVSAIVVIYTSVCQYGLIEAVDVMVAVILGLQTYGNARRFSELAITYNNTLFQLETHKESEKIDVEEKFCDFINKIEETISREHSVWSVKMGKN